MKRDPKETGFAIIWTKEQSTYRIIPEDFEALKAAWRSGQAFFETQSYWGAQLIIKLSIVESIQLSTPESIRLYEEECKAEEQGKLFES